METWAPWSGVGLGSFTPEVSLPILIHHKLVWDSPFFISTALGVSAPPTRLDACGVIPQLLDFHTTQFSDGSECYLFCSLAVIFLWSCEEVNHMYLCLHLDW